MNTLEFIDSVGKSIENRTLFHKKDKLLLSVSGGADSMVMLDVLRILNFEFHVAHINHRLRKQSDKESQLINAYCDQHKISFHLKILSDEELNDLKSGNLQAKARKIRYDFLNELLQNFNLDYICTAHHQEDHVETIFSHLMRGSGWMGLTGIASKSGNIRRPLLSYSKNDILNYIQETKLIYLEDESNFSDVYDRNFIRHHILRPIIERWPDGLNRVSQNSETMADQYALLQHLITEYKSKYIAVQNDRIVINNLSTLATLPGALTFLFELLREYDFSPSLVKSILDNYTNIGAIYFSPTHKILVDRNQLIISPELNLSPAIIIIPEMGVYPITEKTSLEISVSDSKKFTSSKDQEIIDATKINFPLTVEFWSEGDYFYPLGMSGSKKLLSDFFIDEKIDHFSKKHIPILKDCDGHIVWILGMRLDERYKTHGAIERCFLLNYISKS